MLFVIRFIALQISISFIQVRIVIDDFLVRRTFLLICVKCHWPSVIYYAVFHKVE